MTMVAGKQHGNRGEDTQHSDAALFALFTLCREGIA